MAAADRRSAPAVSGVEGIQEAAHRYDFAAALRRFDCAFPDRPRLGRSVRPGDDAVRLAQMPHLGFPAGSLAEWTGGRTAGGTLRVFVLGLLGPNGPLPLHLCEYLLDRVRREGDTTLRAFLDLFHHRVLSLFWRAMAKPFGIGMNWRATQSLGAKLEPERSRSGRCSKSSWPLPWLSPNGTSAKALI